MRSLVDMDTIQIEIVSLCRFSCSNCTRFCGHYEPWFMPLDQFKQAVDSMVEYPKMTGMQGGEPLLHPEFPAMCAYLREKIKPEQLGLWTTLPEGFEHYREDICATFKHIFINDHSRPDIFHHPVLVGVEEIEPDKNKMWQMIDHCWAQESWSASIYPNGAWFCEIAGSMSMLFGEGKGWPIEPGWWWRIPADFREQMDMFCSRCGFPAKVRRRCSQDGIDDISPKNYERLKDKSRKIKRGKYEIYDFEQKDNTMAEAPLARYKDTYYRDRIARRYGMYVVVNEEHFWTPYLLKGWKKGEPGECNANKPVMELYEKFWPTGGPA
jgi:hypothetical protein